MFCLLTVLIKLGLFFLMLSVHYIEVRFASFLSGGFTTMAVINPPEKKLAKRTSVHWGVQIWVNDSINVGIYLITIYTHRAFKSWLQILLLIY